MNQPESNGCTELWVSWPFRAIDISLPLGARLTQFLARQLRSRPTVAAGFVKRSYPLCGYCDLIMPEAMASRGSRATLRGSSEQAAFRLTSAKGFACVCGIVRLERATCYSSFRVFSCRHCGIRLQPQLRSIASALLTRLAGGQS